jgi:hypothetical protein
MLIAVWLALGDTMSAQAQYVRFPITTNWGGSLAYTGMSEVRFIAIPEPATALIGASLLGALVFVRRARAQDRLARS